MSKASNYREALMFDKRTEPPYFQICSHTSRRNDCLAELTAEGVSLQQGIWISRDDSIKLSQAEALKLRDWLTEMFEGK